MSIFATQLLYWFSTAARDLPWRRTKDPYAIWISEVILQQTRVSQGLPYYQKFISAYPTVALLAEAPADDVMRIWQGLGYYSRARNMMHTAQEVVEKHNTSFPNTYAELIKLKGIGPYTAAAIASFSSDEAVPVVDGNVYRVLARYLNIQEDINSTTGKKLFQQAAQSLLPTTQAGNYNQAIMELGALVCKTGLPECLLCPVSDTCASAFSPIATQLPVKVKTLVIRKRSLCYFFIKTENSYLLRKRQEKDIWQGLYEFPLIEMFHNATEIFPSVEAIIGLFGKAIAQPDFVLLHATTHKLTHQELIIQFFAASTQLLTDSHWDSLLESGYTWFTKEQVEQLPKPEIINKFWQVQKS
jgi:A/G-specific adenine glycosylase